MKLSTKSRYGLKIMYFLAQNTSDNFQNVSSIASATGVSEKYIEKLLSGLKSANLIVSSRGNDGGYKLINAPSVITCGQILRAMEEELAFADCVGDGHNCDKNCPNRKVFKKLYDSINSTLDSITLQDMLEENIKENKNGNNK